MKRIVSFIFFVASLGITLFSQDIPQYISYTRVYDFLDEMANERLIDINSAIKPYSRKFIADRLLEIQKKEIELNKRQRDELYFLLEDYALEITKLPDYDIPLWETDQLRLDLLPPVFQYNDTVFRARIQPLLGANIYKNKKGTVTQRWLGIDFQSTIGKGLTIYGSLRDLANIGDTLSRYGYLNQMPGYQYKEASYGFDYSDSRGGVKYAWNWGSVGLIKDNIIWGDNYHGSNIISGRVPSFPMITLRVKPVKWFELNYIHGWLVSNVKDSTKYYIENDTKIHYRNHNKYIAANMFTFTPYRNLNISFGNSIVYAENNIQPGYLLPIAFYKSIDHTLTKGIATENQNSQMFLNISSRNIKHLHLFTSIYADEFSFSRLKSSNKETNPISYKLGGKLSNFPIENLSITGEFTHSNIVTYKHFISVLTYTSNDYNLGHYLGDNAQEFFLSVGYKPVRGLDLSLNYLNAKHGNEYNFIKRIGSNNIIKQIISQPFMNDVIWTNQTIGLNALYEVYNNLYIQLDIENSNIQGHNATAGTIEGEVRMTSQEVLNRYTSSFFQGKNTTVKLGLSFGF
ncbi:MAG: hypothetical protein ACK5L7_00535 [Paludibacteraceae bacterium]